MEPVEPVELVELVEVLEVEVVVEVSQSYCGVVRTGRWRSVPRLSPWLPAGPSLPWLSR